MILNLKPKKIKNLNCYDNNIIADISRFYGRNYQISMLGEFDFTYRFIESVDDLLDYNNIFTGDILYVPQFMSKFVGITLKHIEMIERDDSVHFVNQIISCLKRKTPVGVGLDSYYLPWNPQHGIVHRRHYILIVGADAQNGVFYCVDSYLSGELQKLPMSVISNKCDRLVIVENIKDISEFTINDVVESLIACLSSSGKNIDCNAIRNFAKDIVSGKFSVDIKADGGRIANSNFIFRLTDIANSRYNFLQGLKLIKEKFELIEIDDILDISFNVYKKWDFLKSVIMKGYICGKVGDSLNRASKLLFDIAADEEYILNKVSLLR